MVGLYVANTDNDWFDFLSSRGAITEVNFWRPSAQEFHAIQSGELLVFRLKSPRNRIGGFGVLSSSSVLPLQVAWETFKEANGAGSYEDLRTAIAGLRADHHAGPATNIGCRVLVDPVFFPADVWVNLPESWAKNIVGGKRYSTESSDGLLLWEQLMEVAQGLYRPIPGGFPDSGARFGKPTLITPRLGQGAFRVAVTEAYRRQCAVSGGKVLPALDAAHIRPYADGGSHIKSNGILLRKDIHSVLDTGYATIDSAYRFVVSKLVKDVFNNGEEYRRLHGKSLILPAQKSDWPDPAFLQWHNTNRFLE